MKYAASAATGSYHYYPLRVGHLLVEIAQHSIIAVVCRTRDQKHISVLGVTHIDNAKSFYIVKGSKSGKYLDITAIAATAIKVQQPG
jgi:hypothetical protein